MRNIGCAAVSRSSFTRSLLSPRSAQTFSKKIPILCAGSMTAVADKSWMHFVDISVTKGKIDSCSRIDFKWSDKRKKFGREKTDGEAALLAFMASDGDLPSESCLRMWQNRRMG